MTTGDRIRELRKACGMSQERLAEQLEVSRQTVSEWELNRSLPKVEKWIAMEALFGVSLDELIRGTPYPGSEHPNGRIEAIAERNWRHQKRMMLTLGGALCLACGLVLWGIRCTLHALVTSLEYTLYRYAVVGEWVYSPTDDRNAVLLIALFAMTGVGLLLWSRKEVWKKKKSSETSI